MGFYLTSHPLDAYASSLEEKGIQSSAAILTRSQTGTYRLAGIVMTIQTRIAKSGGRYAFVQLSDTTGVFEVTVFSELLNQYRESLIPGASLLVTVTAQFFNENLRFTCQGIESLEKRDPGRNTYASP